MSRKNDNLLIGALAALLLIVGLWWVVNSGTLDGNASPVDVGDVSVSAVDVDYDRTITPAELPAEAIETLALIDQGGPYPYRKDGSVFQNREGRLPDQPDGYWREYTVDTPGSPDRGARRIVGGDGGERFWTDDHYDSFSLVVP